jgi:hypothetical protein
MLEARRAGVASAGCEALVFTHHSKLRLYWYSLERFPGCYSMQPKNDEDDHEQR